MIEYKLNRFTGDAEIAGKSYATLSWNGSGTNADNHEEVINDIISLKVHGIWYSYTEYMEPSHRWIVTYDSVTSPITITVDSVSNNIVVMTYNDSVQTLFRVVEYMLREPYDKSVTYRIAKVLKCAGAELRKRMR